MIKETIKAIRESFEGSVEIYTNGSCYGFYKILKSIYPHATAYYDSDHVITKIYDKYYDITGEVEIGNHIPIQGNYNEKTFNSYAKVLNYTTCYADPI